MVKNAQEAIQYFLSQRFPDDWWNCKTDYSPYNEKYHLALLAFGQEDTPFCLGTPASARTHRDCDWLEEIIAGLRPQTQRVQKLLDCPCGFGRHSLELSRRGYDVVGVDLNNEYIAHAQAVAAHEKLPCTFIQADMRFLPKFDKFDLIICMNSSFGFFECESDNLLILKKWKMNLNSYGLLILHTTLDIEYYKKYSTTTASYNISDKIIFKTTESYDDTSSRLHGQWETSKERKIALYSQKVYSEDEMKNMLSYSGYTNVKIIPITREEFVQHDIPVEKMYVASLAR